MSVHITDIAGSTAHLTAMSSPLVDGETPKRPRPIRRRSIWLGTAFVIAATVAAVAYWYWAIPPAGTDDAALRRLQTALSHESTRTTAGRVSRFPYAPPPVRTRGAYSGGISPDITIAAAEIDKRARTAGTPAATAALGVAFLATREWDQSVQALEDATESDGANAAWQNDLSVAYAARAAHSERHEDWARALAASARAIRLDSRMPEPYFNRAVALRGLHLISEEAAALTEYTSIDRQGPWTAEAVERLAAIRGPSQSDPAPVEDNTRLRERLERDLFPRWSEAIVRHDSEAASQALAEVERVAGQLAAAGGDTMALDEAQRIRRVERARDRNAIAALAAGHRLFAQARSATDLQVRAEMMAQASRRLQLAGSPYQFWAPVYRALWHRRRGVSREGLVALRGVPLATLPRSYFYFRGRVAWTEALLHENVSRFDRGRERLVAAVEALSSGGETDALLARAILAEAEWFLGNNGGAWTHLMAVFEHADRAPAVFLDLPARMALADGRPEAAFDLLSAELRAVKDASTRAEALITRAKVLVTLGQTTAALRDLDDAGPLVASIGDGAVRERDTADAYLTRADAYSRDDCAQAMRYSDEAMPFLTRTQMTWLGGALATRARCREERGDRSGALAELRSAVELFERRRGEIASPRDRALAFDAERAAFKRLLRFTSVTLGDSAGGLEIAERSRGGALADAWSSAAAAPWSPRDLAADVAILYFEVLPDRVLTWVLTRDGQSALSQPLDDRAVTRAVARIQRAVYQGATVATLRRDSAVLYEALIAPALARADARGGIKPTIVVVPDGPLFSLPFAALPDQGGRPLLDSRTVIVAPSLRTFVAASTRLSHFSPARVLAIGDGHDPARESLPRLTRADDEASEVSRLYRSGSALVGPQAVKRRVLGSGADVLHFAGHSIVNDRFPMLSRMLLAPDPRDGDTGALLASEIGPADFRGTDVVVLATCDGAAGRTVAGEGPISLVRAFFTAGVPAVVGSLWPVDDDVQTLVRVFHRTLIAERDAGRALRAAQRALLAERGPQTPVRVWGGFVAYGGSTPRR